MRRWHSRWPLPQLPRRTLGGEHEAGGLNVAADPLMSSAYTGVKGGFVVISADDPGQYSQTEQDSRLMAMLAKIPVFRSRLRP